MDEDSEDEEAYTAAVDMWALGEVLYYMLTQKSAFSSRREAYLFVANQKALNENPLIAQGISDACKEFLRRVLVADPKDRLDAQAAGLHAWLSQDVTSTNSVLPV